jgi:hypothetical protein
MVLNGPRRFFKRNLLILYSRFSVFLKSPADGIEWADLFFLKGNADVIEQAQTSCLNVLSMESNVPWQIISLNYIVDGVGWPTRCPGILKKTLLMQRQCFQNSVFDSIK